MRLNTAANADNASRICVEEEHFLFFLMYLIGRYIRKADLVTKLKINAGRMYWLTTVCIFAICYLLFLFTPLNTAALQDKVPVALNYRAPFVILQAQNDTSFEGASILSK